MNAKILNDVEAYVSFENGKWKYVDEGGLLNLYRHNEFHTLANKSEIQMFHKILELENSKKIEYDCDGKRVK